MEKVDALESATEPCSMAASRESTGTEKEFLARGGAGGQRRGLEAAAAAARGLWLGGNFAR
uniref:Uncharacterized protein n=1 Tax=Aegilops tauschii TaxID=37682 RepID=M8CPP0_AEGTA